MELGGIEPPSVERLPAPVRPFPVAALRVAHRRVDCPLGLRRIFLRCQWSFPPSAVFPCCPPLLLLPGCSGQAPRAPVGVAVTSQTNQVIRLRGARVHHCRVFGAPFLESEQLRSRSTVPGPNVETDQPLVNVQFTLYRTAATSVGPAAATSVGPAAATSGALPGLFLFRGDCNRTAIL